MSKGSRVVPVRFEEELLDAVAAMIASSNERRQGEPWTTSEFVRAAVREKLAKMKRSAGWRARKRRGGVA